MSADVSPFKTSAAALPSVRAIGCARLVAERVAGQTVAIEVEEEGPLRLRFLRTEAAALEAILVNTGGGIVGGDRLTIAIEAGSGAAIAATSQAAEKIYRSAGPNAEISVRLKADSKASLHWVPQESILFDQAKVRRSIDVDLAADATLTICETIVFGRTAMGESVRNGYLRDHWRVRRAGELVFAEALLLDGPVADVLQRPAVGDGAVAVSTVLHVAREAEAKLALTRAVLSETPLQAGASAFDGLLVVRSVARDAVVLRDAVLKLLSRLGLDPPRAYSL